MLVMYMVMSFFRGKSPPTDTQSAGGTEGVPAKPGLPSVNLYSETSKFVSNSLFGGIYHGCYGCLMFDE